jgi:cysteine desulfurase / selenocysteine lyase
MNNIKKDFNILKKDITYLDSAATSLTPNSVVKAISSYYNTYNSNIHRGTYKLSLEATELYENVRKKIAKFINAEVDEIIFTKGTTESINIISNSLNLKKNDNIVLTKFEHHSNIVPWQILCDKQKNEIKYLDMKNFQIDLNSLNKINKNTKIVSFTYASNVLGTILPVQEIIKKAKENKSLTHIDAAQIIPHKKIDVKKLDCDFLSFSGHKILGPTGIGILYGKKKHLEKMKPLLYGGNMISEVNLNKTKLNELPFKFEAGTPNISGVFGLGEAIEYIKKISFEKIHEHEKNLTKKLIEGLEKENVIIYGLKDINNRLGIVAFNIKNIHYQDLNIFLGGKNIAIRSGHHCAMPLIKELNIDGCCRASLYFYNTIDDVNKLIDAIKEAKKYLVK